MNVRRELLKALTILLFVTALASTLMVFAQDRLFDATSFGSTVAAAAKDPAVNSYLADEISNALIAEAPDLAIGGPLLSEVTAAALSSDIATRTLEAASRETHEAVFERGQDAVFLDLADLVVTIEQALLAVNPELASAVPADISSLAIDVSSGEFSIGLARLAERLQMLTIALLIVTALLMVTVVVLDKTAYRGLSRIGLALAGTGLVLVVLRGVGATVIGSYGRTPLEADALAGGWNVVLGDLARWGWVLVFAGGFLASLGWAVLRAANNSFDLRELANRATAEPRTRSGRAIRFAALLLAVVWALLHPETLLTTAIRIAGFVGAVAMGARLLVSSGISQRLAALAPEQADHVVGVSDLARRSIAPVGLIAGLALAGVWVLSANDNASALIDPEACNGHVELCQRSLAEITLATSHNSMSSTATGFYLPNNLTTIRAQLDQGVRGFMIDTIYGRRAPDGSVRTSVDLVTPASLDAGAANAAKMARDRQTTDLDEETIFLCHAFCEIGALDAVEELRSVRAWLEDNPREVVVFVVQDATSPEDTASIFVDAGFEDVLFTKQPGASFPTLSEMIQSEHRVLVLVEENPGEIEWLHPAFELAQETPFSFASADEFTCTSNRGRPENPLFVVNHFITLAQPSNATINDFAPLFERADTCRTERGLQPNLLAVDFVSEGDVMAVIDALNGLD